MKSLTLMAMLMIGVCIVACSGDKDATRQQAHERTVNGKTDVVTVYYFHNNHRCATCTMFEETINGVVKNDFSNQIQSGTLAFESLNMDEDGNKHYLKTYKLHTKAIIISVIKDGKEVEWKNLDKIWELARNKEELAEYIRSGIAGLIKA